MSKLKEKSEYMAMRVSGFLGWVHRIVMLITFPIRKFWLIVTVCAVVLAILIAIPLCYGIPFRDIWDWYMIKMPSHEFVEAKDKTLFNMEDGFNKVKRTVKEIVPSQKTEAEKNAEEEKNRGPQFISWNVAEFKRARYKPHKQIPVIKKIEVDVEEKVISAKTPEGAEKSKKKTVEETEIAPTEGVIVKERAIVAENNEPSFMSDVANNKGDEQNNELAVAVVEETKKADGNVINFEEYYVKLESEDLSYNGKPEIIEGNARVIGPNAMYVNGEFVFLYGIYSHPKRHDVEAATQYLKSITQGKRVGCAVVAYSKKTQSATGLCFVNGVFINKLLTEHNLAKNVALK